jgi:hypothetical protein
MSRERRPEFARSWCPKCNEWSMQNVGGCCLWCDDSGRIPATRTVDIAMAKPWLRVPMNVRYPNLVNRMMVTANG